MHTERLEQIINIISKGDTNYAEALFNKPFGKKYLESIVAIVLSNVPGSFEEKEEVFMAFIKTLNKIENRIRRQKEGEKVLKQLIIS